MGDGARRASLGSRGGGSRKRPKNRSFSRAASPSLSISSRLHRTRPAAFVCYRLTTPILFATPSNVPITWTRVASQKSMPRLRSAPSRLCVGSDRVLQAEVLALQSATDARSGGVSRTTAFVIPMSSGRAIGLATSESRRSSCSGAPRTIAFVPAGVRRRRRARLRNATRALVCATAAGRSDCAERSGEEMAAWAAPALSLLRRRLSAST